MFYKINIELIFIIKKMIAMIYMYKLFLILIQSIYIYKTYIFTYLSIYIYLFIYILKNFSQIYDLC